MFKDWAAKLAEMAGRQTEKIKDQLNQAKSSTSGAIRASSEQVSAIVRFAVFSPPVLALCFLFSQASDGLKRAVGSGVDATKAAASKALEQARPFLAGSRSCLTPSPPFPGLRGNPACDQRY